jgi:hypothetical protein
MKATHLISIVFCWMLFSCNAAEKDNKILELEKEVKELKGFNDTLEDRNSELANKVSDLERKLAGLPQEYSNEDFWTFFWKFMTDSSFQTTRIKFPVDYVTWKELPNGNIDLGGEIVTIKIAAKDWKYDNFYINTANERTQVYDNFNLKFQPTNERVLHWFGVETCGDSRYYFKGFDGEWYLVKKEQLGN